MTKEQRKLEALARRRLEESRRANGGESKEGGEEKVKRWVPDLNPTQKLMFFDDSPYVYAHGPRGTGKGIGLLHKGIKHCYENQGALWIIVTRTARQGSLGLKADLERLIIPQWEDEIGLRYIPFMMDGATKDWSMWIESYHDDPGHASSQVVLMSVPHVSQVEARAKALSPSMVYIDELTEFESEEVIQVLSQQVGRRAGMRTAQQLTASMNPKGESHWAYRMLFIDPYDEETGEKIDDTISVYRVPFEENKHRLSPGYYEKHVIPVLRKSPIEYKRLVEGVWIDKPTGRSLFGPFLDEDRHIIGDRARGTGLSPSPDVPIVVGMDPGVKWTGVVFMQYFDYGDRRFWTVFDEIALSDYHTHKYLAKRIVMKMDKWDKKLGRDMRYLFVSDSSATNQFRSGEDRYDSVALIRHSNGRIPRITGVNKPSGSKKMRVSLTQDLLASDQIYVSASCDAVCNMLRFLESDKNDPDTPKRQENSHIHVFDAMSYVFYKFEVNPSINPSSKKTPASLILCGTGD